MEPLRPTYVARGCADLAFMGRVLAAVAFVVVAGCLDGCSHVGTVGAPWTEPFPRFDVPELPAVPDDAPDAAALDAGDAAPYDGNLLPVELLDRCDAAETQRDVLIVALDLAYTGRADDRAAAEVVFAARETQLRQARAAGPRWFIVGGAAGGGAVLAVLLAVLAR